MKHRNIRKRINHLLVLTVAAVAVQARVSAVELSYDGTGDVAIIPYISADNGFNSLFSIRNTGDTPVATRLVVRNGDDGSPLATAILFLSPAQQLRMAAARLIDHDAILFPETTACVLGSQPADNFPEIPASDRIDHAWAEVYEVGTLTADQAEGLRDNCDSGQELIGTTLNPASGALAVDAHLIHVFYGFNLTLQTTVLRNFGGPAQLHSLTTDAPSLDDARAESTIAGQTLTWSTGAAAVSSVLALSSFSSVFQAEEVVDGKTDIVLTFPTRHLLSPSPESPFEPEGENGQLLPMSIVNREGADVSGQPTSKCTPPPPPQPPYFGPELQGSQMSIHFQPDPLLAIPVAEPAGIDMYAEIGGCIFTGFEPVWDFMEAGSVHFSLAEHSATSLEGSVVTGLPVLPVSITTISNGILVDETGERFLSNYGLTNAIALERGVPSKD